MRKSMDARAHLWPHLLLATCEVFHVRKETFENRKKAFEIEQCDSGEMSYHESGFLVNICPRSRAKLAAFGPRTSKGLPKHITLQSTEPNDA